MIIEVRDGHVWPGKALVPLCGHPTPRQTPCQTCIRRYQLASRPVDPPKEAQS